MGSVSAATGRWARVGLLGLGTACARPAPPTEARSLVRPCAVSDSQLARARAAGAATLLDVCRLSADSMTLAARPDRDSSTLSQEGGEWMRLHPNTAGPQPDPSRAAHRPYDACVGAIDSAILVYRVATADRDARARRRLGGPHTCLGSPSDVAVNRRGELYVLSRGPYDRRGGWTNAVTVFATGDSGDAVPRRRIWSHRASTIPRWVSGSTPRITSM